MWKQNQLPGEVEVTVSRIKWAENLQCLEQNSNIFIDNHLQNACCIFVSQKYAIDVKVDTPFRDASVFVPQLSGQAATHPDKDGLKLDCTYNSSF